LESFKGNLLIIAAGNDHIIPDEVKKMLHESAKYAKINPVYKLPDAEHPLLMQKKLWMMGI
jgi:hypothetical protein